VARIDKATLVAWRAEADRRSLYVLDVRTPEEYEAGHLRGACSAPGGQLVQEPIRLSPWGARKLGSYAAAFRHLRLTCPHEQGLRQNNRAENSRVTKNNVRLYRASQSATLRTFRTEAAARWQAAVTAV
jgi:rhodanese-related sulfurtransferase